MVETFPTLCGFQGNNFEGDNIGLMFNLIMNKMLIKSLGTFWTDHDEYMANAAYGIPLCQIDAAIVITFYSPSCLGQETEKGPFGLRVKLPPAHLSTTSGGGLTLFL